MHNGHWVYIGSKTVVVRASINTKKKHLNQSRQERKENQCTAFKTWRPNMIGQGWHSKPIGVQRVIRPSRNSVAMLSTLVEFGYD